ncbi:MAG: 5'-nucleotidase C-terminal domain-containing protein [Aeromicrobium sp.]
MTLTARGLATSAVAALMGGSLLVAAPAQAADDVTINLIGINDFHGRVDADTLKWAKVIEDLKVDGGGDAASLLVSAGDNVGASVFASAIQKDEPTIDILNSIGLDASAVGNHEFDLGYEDLVDRIVPRADFEILGANVRKADDSRALPAYKIFTVGGVKIAVIGAVTQETPTLVSPDRVDGLTFGDPSDSINQAVTELNALPAGEKPDVMVASFHEGAPDGTATLESALASNAVFRRLVENTSGDVDAIFMGHTHQKYVYNAQIPGAAAGKTRPIVQTGQYGENVGQIKLTVNPDTDIVSAAVAKTVARGTDADAAVVTKYPQLQAVKDLRDQAVAFAEKEGNVAKGEITADITRAFVDPTAATPVEDRASESTLGNVVADALLYRVGSTDAGADLSLVNPGGLRVDLKYAGIPGDAINADGVVTRAELNTVLPFANNLNSVALTGADIKEIFEQQWQTALPGQPTPSRAYLQLGTSDNVSYTYDATRPQGDRILEIRVDGEPIVAGATYRVATFSFLAAGGDNFRAFKNGQNTDTALVDRDGWETFFADNSPVSPSYRKHAVQTSGVKDQYGPGGDVSLTYSKLDLTSLGSPANRTISSRLFYGDEQSLALPSRPVSGGSATLAFKLPKGSGGPARIESTAFPSGTKVVVPLDVSGAGVTADNVAATYGQDVDVVVEVTDPAGTPTGQVALKDGDTVVGTGTITAGAATIPVDTEDLGAGATTLTIAYPGTGTAIATGSVVVTVAKATTTTTAVTPEPAPVNEDIGIDVDVASATGTQPTGEVTISSGATVIGRGALTAGDATVSTDLSGLPVGRTELSVAYAGDADHGASSAKVTVDVLKGAAPITATAAGSSYGTPSVVTVKGDPGASGLVSIVRGEQVVGMGILQNGTATVQIAGTTFTPGSYTLEVRYGGSATFDAVTTTVGLTITKAVTTVKKVSVSPSKIVKGRTKPFVNLTVKAPGYIVEGGTVTLRQGGKSYRGTVKNGKVRIRLGKFTSSGSAKKVTATYYGTGLAAGDTTTFTVKVAKK